MNQPLRKSLGVLGIGLCWGVAWSTFFATFALYIIVFRPREIEPGDGPLPISVIGFIIGCVCGTLFGAIVSFAENRKSLHDLALVRIACWGLLASAAWPLLTPLPDEMVFVLCPLGVICAAFSVVIARRAEFHPQSQISLFGWFGRLLARPLNACLCVKRMN